MVILIKEISIVITAAPVLVVVKLVALVVVNNSSRGNTSRISRLRSRSTNNRS